MKLSIHHEAHEGHEGRKTYYYKNTIRVDIIFPFLRGLRDLRGLRVCSYLRRDGLFVTFVVIFVVIFAR
jgi:hypothetical protein